MTREVQERRDYRCHTSSFSSSVRTVNYEAIGDVKENVTSDSERGDK